MIQLSISLAEKELVVIDFGAMPVAYLDKIKVHNKSEVPAVCEFKIVEGPSTPQDGDK